MKILVFPIDMDQAIKFVRSAKTMGISIITASSEISVKGEEHSHIHLPYVNHIDFNSEITLAIKKYKIDRIYTPNAAIWDHINLLISQNYLNITLCGYNPFEDEWLEIEPNYLWAESIANSTLASQFHVSNKQVTPALSIAQYASLHRQFLTVPGQTDELKLETLTQLIRVLPKGNLIEIGSLSGRSALALAWLADKYNIGSLVCIDPWDEKGKVHSQGKKADMLNKNSSSINFTHIFMNFMLTAAQLNNIAYIKAISVNALDIYNKNCASGSIKCEQLSEIKLSTQTSLIHIDGNHKYEYVKEDIQTWANKLCSGGWLLIDDYVWAFGDGPQQAGDELLTSGEFDSQFCMSDTLFLRKK